MTVGALIFEHHCGTVGILLQEFYKYKILYTECVIPEIVLPPTPP